MTDLGLDFMGLLPHDLQTEEKAFGLAVARALEARHPIYTAKNVAQDVSAATGRDCDVRTAENILAGHLSARTLTKLARTYGLGLLIEAGAAVTGVSLDQFIVEETQRAQHEIERAAAARERFVTLQAQLLARSEARAARAGA
jgi:hypothetical protein